MRGAPAGLRPSEKSTWRNGGKEARAGRLQKQLVRGAPEILSPSKRIAWSERSALEQEEREQVAYRSSL